MFKYIFDLSYLQAMIEETTIANSELNSNCKRQIGNVLFTLDPIFVTGAKENLELVKNIITDEIYSNSISNLVVNMMFQNFENKINVFENIDEALFSKNKTFVFSKDEINLYDTILINKFNDCNNFFHNLTTSLKLNNNLDKVEKLKHPCNSIIILDPYWSVDYSEQENLNKIPSIIKFIENFICDNDEKFHITFLGSNKAINNIKERENVNNILNRDINLIKEGLSSFSKIEISAITTKKPISANRRVYTNYLNCFYDHLFDREGKLSSTFIFETKDSLDNENDERDYLKKNIDEYINEINKIKEFIKSELYKHPIVYGNPLNNPLFDI